MLREYQSLNFILNQLLDKPLKNKDLILTLILLLGLFQLKNSRIPKHAIINETVNLCKIYKYDYASSLTNAILRRFDREQEQLLEKLNQQNLSEHPAWLEQMIKENFPHTWAEIFKANNTPAPMYLRVNQRKISTQDYLKLLNTQEIKASIHEGIPETLTLKEPIDVNELPNFDQGFVSVQDLAAQLAAHLLELKPGQSVLDACAAPGGKSCHMLELCDIDLSCLDSSEKRLQRVTENLERLNLKAKLIRDDASTAFKDQTNLFDRILVDAPCSGTGVIRRHPDIKFLRQATDINQFHQLQVDIIKNLIRVLKPGGILLYSTCSILAKENDQTIEEIITKFPQIKLEKINLNHLNINNHASNYGQQLSPVIKGHDGFYYAKLIKLL